MNGNWGELRDKFCLKFFPESRLISLRKGVICFQQNEKESLGAAWARFLLLVKSGLVLSVADYVLLEHFYSGLDMDSASYLDMTDGVSLLVFLMPKRIDILQAHRITIVALHLRVFQGTIIFLREALWIKSIEESNDKLY